MIDFLNTIGLDIPDGEVVKVEVEGVTIWSNIFGYTSFGDSIAAGHSIDSDWEKNYGTASQYGEGSNASTVIVPGCYTQRIENQLETQHGIGKTSTISFAHSGDRVSDLIEILDHIAVKEAIQSSKIITVCIGANDILGPALNSLESYIANGSPTLAVLGAEVDANIAVLNDDTSTLGFTALFNKLYAINPNAQYVFMNIYNPIKYLWLEEGKTGFFKPIFDFIHEYLQLTILGFEVDEYLGDRLLSTNIVRLLFDRVNGLGDWAEGYLLKLNNVLSNKIQAYHNTHPNFLLADSKSLFESFPDRPVSATKHYNDLVNIEYTKGYDTAQMDWGRLWEGKSASSYWTDLAYKYITDSFNVEGFATELVNDMITRVIVPDIDPHPEIYGHYVLNELFSASLGYSELNHYSITFNSNGGLGAMEEQYVTGVIGLPAYTQVPLNQYNPPGEGYRFIGWNTKADGSGISYSIGQVIGLTSDLVLYAQWSDIYTLTYRHSENSDLHGSSDTGPMESYALWIDGVEQSDLGAFSNEARKISLRYGTPVGVVAQTKYGDGRSHITLNGTKIVGDSKDAQHTFLLTGDTDIHFIWTYAVQADLSNPQVSYWKCNITT